MSETNVQYVNTPGRLTGVIDAVRRTDRVALDTEFVSEGTYEPVLCLVQIATAEGIWLVDPLAVSDLKTLWEELTSPDRELIALAAREEIRFCLRGAGRAPTRLLDPQLAAGLLGYGYPLSHTNLVRKALGVEVAGGEAFTDWRQRPLSNRQLDYAADDVRHLLVLRDRLLAEADRLGRTEWVWGECARLAEKVAAAEREERWRVSGSAGLSRKELGVLREVWRWRDESARRSNTPPRRIMRDELLIEIARRKPANVADLFALRGLDRGAARSSGPAIVAAVQAALQLPNAELPESWRRDDPPQVGVLAQLLAVSVSALSAEYGIDPQLLATSADLQDLIRWRLNGKPSDPEPPLLSGWRGEILGQPLRELLEGRRHLRVVNLKAANPLAFEREDEGGE